MIPFFETDHRIAPLDVSIRTGDYLRAAFEQGMEDTVLGFIGRRIDNFDVDLDGGELLPPERLNDIYGMEGLRFDHPMTEQRAQLMAARKKAENDRMFALQHGTTGPARFLGGLGAGLVGSIANPLDFGVNAFLPFVGPSRAAGTAVKASRAARFLRGGGIVTAEELARAGLPAGPVFTAVFEGTLANAAIEIPLAFEKIILEHDERYGIDTAAFNIAVGGAFAGGLRLGLEGLSRALSRLDPSTHSAATAHAVRQMAQGQPLDVHRVIELDDSQIREIVMERALARAEEGTPFNLASERAPAEAGIAPPKPVSIDVASLTQAQAAKEFDRLIGEYGEFFGWVEALKTEYPLLGERRSFHAKEMVGSEMKQGRDRALRELGVAGESKKTETRAAALSKLIEHINNRAQEPDWDVDRPGLGFDPAERNARIADAIEARKAEIFAERERLFNKYFEDEMPKTPEERKAFVDRYQAERAAALNQVIQRGAALTPEETSRYTDLTPEKELALVIEQMDSIKGLIPDETLKLSMPEKAVVPNWQKGIKAAADCILNA